MFKQLSHRRLARPFTSDSGLIPHLPGLAALGGAVEVADRCSPPQPGPWVGDSQGGKGGLGPLLAEPLSTP